MRRTISLTALLTLLAAGGLNAASRLDSAKKLADQSCVRRLLSIADDADEDDQRATARQIRARAIEIRPTDLRARADLGYRKARGKWVRDEEKTAELRGLEDSDPNATAAFRRRVLEAENDRASAIARAVQRANAVEDHRDLLLSLLARSPRNTEVHEALGHELIGDDLVRPELADAVRGMAARAEAWAECRDLAPDVAQIERMADLPGIARPLPLARVGGRTMGAAYSVRASRRVAQSMEATQTLLARLMGKDSYRWDPATVYFLYRGDYRGLIHANHSSDAERERFLRVRTYGYGDYFALSAENQAIARDLYAHSVGYYTIEQVVTPADEDGNVKDEDWAAHGWLKEGLGYFLSLELCDSADSWFVNEVESSAKLRHTVPPPEERNRATCLAWVRAHLLEGTAFTLREVCGKSVNSLDLLASMEAWTFLRFLAHYRPEGFRLLPSSLLEQEEGSYLDRANRALLETCGAGIDELEPLWRAFTLEIE